MLATHSLLITLPNRKSWLPATKVASKNWFRTPRLSTNASPTDWDNVQIDKPEFTGVQTLIDFPLEEIRPYIDWSPFFMTWELKGKYPKIFEDATVGEVAREVYDKANTLLDRLITEKTIQANAVYAFWPAASDGDDIILYEDESRKSELARFHCLRQQWERKGQKDFRSLADYVAPATSGREELFRRVRRHGRHRCR